MSVRDYGIEGRGRDTRQLKDYQRGGMGSFASLLEFQTIKIGGKPNCMLQQCYMLNILIIKPLKVSMFIY